MLDHITLPHTDLRVSCLSLGTANYGVNNSEYEVFTAFSNEARIVFRSFISL